MLHQNTRTYPSLSCLTFTFVYIPFSPSTFIVFTEQNTNLKMITRLFLSFTLLLHFVHPRPFPDQMLHGTDETTVRHALQRAGYQTTNIPTPTQVSRSIPLHSLMPYQCNFSQIDSFTVSPTYGVVGFQSHVYST